MPIRDRTGTHGNASLIWRESQPGGRMLGDIQMQNLSSRVAEDNAYVQQAKRGELGFRWISNPSCSTTFRFEPFLGQNIKPGLYS